MPPDLTRECPSCAGTSFVPFLRKGDLVLVKCSKCAMVFANPVPLEMASGTFYDRAGGEYLSPDKLASDYADVRFERELRLFRAQCQHGSVLDVGCSSGAFLYQLNKRFPGDYKILGTDVSTGPLDHAAKMGVPIARGNFLNYAFTEQFNAITFWAVMEHLFEPRLFLERAVSLLKPGGLCFILVPNLDSLAVRLLGKKYRYIFPEHLNYFNAHTLRAFVGSRLTLQEIGTTHFNPIVIAQDFRHGQRDVPRAERSHLLKRTNTLKQSPWFKPLKLAYHTSEKILGAMQLADNLVIVGRKSAK